MKETTLRGVMANWPPTAGAGLSEAPIAELNDVIRRASVSRGGHLVLSLARDQMVFTAAEQIDDNHVEAVRRLAPHLREKTIEVAGRCVLKTDE